jgi:hypothetical protein
MYINTISMFKKHMSPVEKAQAKLEKIKAKNQRKMAKKQIRLEKKQKLLEIKHGAGSKEPKKHIGSFSIVGSKLLSSISGFTAVASFYEYFSMHSILYAGIFAGATLAVAAVASAPYIRNAGRVNRTLGEVVQAMDGVDRAVGTQQALVSAVAAEVEKVLQAQGIVPEIKKMQAQIADLQKQRVQPQQPNQQANAQPDIHTSKNVKLE